MKPETKGERGFPKKSVRFAELKTTGLEGDFNRLRSEKKQNTLDRALLILPLETIEDLGSGKWKGIKPGDLGENITTERVDYDFFEKGKNYCLGNAIVQITGPCDPCVNLALLPYIGKERITEFMETLVGRRGWYAKVITPGVVREGDPIDLMLAPLRT